MYRRSSDGSEALAAGLVGMALVVAALVIAVLAIVLVALIKELWRIFKAQAFHAGQASRILWGALVGLLGLWLVAGLLATNPNTASLGLVLACWSFFIFVLICEFTDWYSRRAEPKVPKQLSLADVVSWQAPGTTGRNAAKVKENGHVPSPIALP